MSGMAAMSLYGETLLGGELLFIINVRLQQLFMNDFLFGGLSIILCGDSAQLPAIGDLACWKQGDLTSDGLKHPIAVRGIQLFRNFTSGCVFRTNMRAVRGDSQVTQFVDVLEQLRLNQLSPEGRTLK